MIGILLFIVLVATFYLYIKTLKLQRKVDQSLSQEQLETALDAFIIELKADNEALIEHLNGFRTSDQEHTRVGTIKEYEDEQEQIVQPAQCNHSYENVDQRKLALESETDVFLLNQKGYTSKQIAKHLNIGISEVSLMLEFNKKKKRMSN
ncbi:hypothetical protein [Shouchella patagoniensis]|uniref:hypothetical protein n=1 Tax=Shouchella patagoniensis TaxID=228576 RepID=UPI0009954FB3|nr:hypothetical protein [Shouchella patagoniensis]